MGKVELTLPDELHERLRTRVSLSGFDSDSEYTLFLLETALESIPQDEKSATETVDKAEVKDRLESLGYL